MTDDYPESLTLNVAKAQSAERKTRRKKGDWKSERMVVGWSRGRFEDTSKDRKVKITENRKEWRKLVEETKAHPQHLVIHGTF